MGPRGDFKIIIRAAAGESDAAYKPTPHRPAEDAVAGTPCAPPGSKYVIVDIANSEPSSPDEDDGREYGRTNSDRF